MKAVRIDPFNRTIDTVLVPDPNTPEGWSGAGELILHDRDRGILETVGVGPEVMMIVDEEGLLLDPEQQAYWSFGFPWQSHMAGVALMFGWEPNVARFTDVFFTPSQIEPYVVWKDAPSQGELRDLTTPRIIPLS